MARLPHTNTLTHTYSHWIIYLVRTQASTHSRSQTHKSQLSKALAVTNVCECMLLFVSGRNGCTNVCVKLAKFKEVAEDIFNYTTKRNGRSRTENFMYTIHDVISTIWEKYVAEAMNLWCSRSWIFYSELTFCYHKNKHGQYFGIFIFGLSFWTCKSIRENDSSIIGLLRNILVQRIWIDICLMLFKLSVDQLPLCDPSNTN